VPVTCYDHKALSDSVINNVVMTYEYYDCFSTTTLLVLPDSATESIESEIQGLPKVETDYLSWHSESCNTLATSENLMLFLDL